jgi:hypothetical protein
MGALVRLALSCPVDGHRRQGDDAQSETGADGAVAA